MKNLLKVLTIVLLSFASVNAETPVGTDTQAAETELAALLKELEQAEPKDSEEDVTQPETVTPVAEASIETPVTTESNDVAE